MLPRAFTKVTFFEHLNGTPARVNRLSGELQISKRDWDKLTYENRVFILMHEAAHLFLQTKNELCADSLALIWYLNSGLPVSKSLKTLTKILNYQMLEHYDRTNAVALFAKHYDNLIRRKMTPHLELQKVIEAATIAAANNDITSVAMLRQRGLDMLPNETDRIEFDAIIQSLSISNCTGSCGCTSCGHTSSFDGDGLVDDGEPFVYFNGEIDEADVFDDDSIVESFDGFDDEFSDFRGWFKKARERRAARKEEKRKTKETLVKSSDGLYSFNIQNRKGLRAYKKYECMLLARQGKPCKVGSGAMAGVVEKLGGVLGGVLGGAGGEGDDLGAPTDALERGNASITVSTGEEKKGLPVWAWVLIAVGGLGLIGGGIWAAMKYGKK